MLQIYRTGLSPERCIKDKQQALLRHKQAYMFLQNGASVNGNKSYGML